MKEVNKIRLDVVEQAIRGLENRGDWYCTLARKFTWKGEVEEFQVNWCCMGGTNTEVARKVSKQLEFMSNLVDELNKMEIVTVRGDDSIITNEEIYNKYLDCIQKSIEAERYADIIYFLWM